jgi:hypothetical protein
MSKSPSLCGICEIRHISKPLEAWCPDCEEGICTDFLINTPFSGAVLFYTEDTIGNEKNTTPREQFYIIIRNLMIIFGT